MPDSRGDNRSWLISTLLTLICMGLLAGRTSLAAHHGTLPRALAIDGKYISDLLLSLPLAPLKASPPPAPPFCLRDRRPWARSDRTA